MSNKAITTNDLKAVLDVVLPPTPSEYKKLLWTNPSPTSSFAAQTVSLDLSDFDEIELFYAGINDYTSTAVDCVKIAVSKGSLLNMSANEIWWRYVTTSSSGVTFDTGYRTPTYGGNGTADNRFIIPLKIYGIKYERVASPQVDASDYVIEQGSNSNGSYRKWESGAMEQWSLEASASASAHNVSFPEAFISTAYVVVGTNTSGTQSNFMTSSTNVAYFTVYPTANTQLFWIAYGKWK